MATQRTRVRQSLLRPLLIFGAERELVFATGMVTAVLVMALISELAFAGVAIVFWAITLFALQRMAKNDPQMSQIYIRHLNKKIYYPAAPHLSALEPEPKKHQ